MTNEFLWPPKSVLTFQTIPELYPPLSSHLQAPRTQWRVLSYKNIRRGWRLSNLQIPTTHFQLISFGEFQLWPAMKYIVNIPSEWRRVWNVWLRYSTRFVVVSTIFAFSHTNARPPEYLFLRLSEDIILQRGVWYRGCRLFGDTEILGKLKWAQHIFRPVEGILQSF